MKRLPCARVRTRRVPALPPTRATPLSRPSPWLLPVCVRVEPCPPWSVYRQATYGHGELTATNSSHLYWAWCVRVQYEAAGTSASRPGREGDRRAVNAVAHVAPPAPPRPAALCRNQNEDLEPGYLDALWVVKGEQVEGAGTCTTGQPRLRARAPGA